jgi:1-deoxy-D-xylulose-5-phosphate synthase
MGKAEIVHKGGRIAMLAWGSMVAPAIEAGKKLGATVINMRFIKPIDADLILEMAKSHDVLITVEENVISGGAGSAVNVFLQAQQILMPVLNLGLPDEFIEQGTREELLSQCGLDTKGIIASIEAFAA